MRNYENPEDVKHRERIRKLNSIKWKIGFVYIGIVGVCFLTLLPLMCCAFFDVFRAFVGFAGAMSP
jgi:hypothetical protein